MASLPPSDPAGLRLSLMEYVDTTPGPEWGKNSCWIDTALWVAKVTGLTQHIQDERTAADSPLRERVWALLRQNWRTLGRASLSVQRDALLDDYYSANDKLVRGDFGNLQLFFEFMCTGLPTLALHQAMVTRCRCKDRTRLSTAIGTDVPGWGVKEYLGEAAAGAILNDVLEAVFGWQYTGWLCEKCHADQTRVMAVETDLPPLLLLYGPPLEAVRSQGHAPLEFPYRSAPSLDKHTARYKIRGLAIGTEDHFFALVPGQPNTPRDGVYCWDGLKNAGNVQYLTRSEFDARLNRLEQSALRTSVLVLERLG